MRHLHYQLGLALLLLASPLWAVTDRYIDGGCTNNGDGTAVDCASSPGGAGPYNALHNVFPSNEVCGSGQTIFYHIRGVHGTHGSNHAAGTFDGRYFGNEWAIDQTCTSTTAMTIQPYGYGSSQERVYLDGTRCPSAGSYSNTGAAASCGSGTGWTQCTWDGNCDCTGYATNLVDVGDGSQTACQETWFTLDSGTPGSGFQTETGNTVLWAQKDDGSITFPVASRAGLTNAHGGYNASRCTNSADSGQKWMPCSSNSDCLSGETCSGSASPEIDSYRDTSTTPDAILVRWGTGSQAPGTAKRPYIGYTQAGTGFTLKKESAFITVRGFDFRCHRISSVYSNGDADGANRGDNTVTDNRVFFTSDTGGSDYGMVFYQANRATASANEIAYTNSEGIHANSYNSASTSVITISGNYIHNQGDQAIMGVASTAGTPVGITVNPSENASATFNMTGSVIEKNLIVDIKARPDVSSTYGIRLEHCVTGMVVRNNVLLRAGTNFGMLSDSSNGNTAACDNATVTGQEWYNNLIIDQGANCFQLSVYGTNTLDGNKWYNNTCVNPGSLGCFVSEDFTGTFSNNIIRNNICSTGTTKAINIAAPAAGSGNVFDFNLLRVTGGGNAATWLGTTKACADVPDLGAGNRDNCPDPGFAGASDFHLTSGSDAKDTGTSTGMPSGRTADINNMLASSHGLASYADNQACSGTCDIGADEFVASPTGRRKIIVVVGQ